MLLAEIIKQAKEFIHPNKSRGEGQKYALHTSGFVFSSNIQRLLYETCISVPEFLHVDDYINACMFKKKKSLQSFS